MKRSQAPALNALRTAWKMSDKGDNADRSQSGDGRSDPLEETRQRITRLEVEAHRLRADLARMEAEREDTIADTLEAGRSEALAAGDTSIGPLVAAAPVTGPKPTLSTRVARDNVHVEPAPIQTGKPAAAPPEEAIQEAPPLFERARAPSVKKPIGKPRSDKRRAPSRLPARGDGPSAPNPPIKKRRIKLPPFLVSVLVHVVLLFLFGLATFATLQNDPQLFFASASETDDLSDEMIEFSEFEFEESEIENVELEEVTFESVVENAMEVEAPEMESAAAAEIGAALSDMAAMDVGSLMTAVNVGGAADGGTSGQGSGDASGGKSGATSFFGRKVQAGRVMYVLDNSASMIEGRMETALMEVQKSVMALSPKQSFYVCVYSDEAFPMFYPQPTLQMIPATPANKERLANWLTTVPIGPGSYKSQIAALEGAVNLRPDVIYLLTDEDIRSSVAKEFLLTPRRFGVPMHVFGMTATNAEGIALLEAIALAQGGGYQGVQISPEAQQQARTKPIRRYRNAGEWVSSMTAPGAR